jgi:tRNA (guanine10-N2)-methyltransferase
MDFLIRFCQSHETFRLREVEALATLHGIDLQVKEYKSDVRRKFLPIVQTY